MTEIDIKIDLIKKQVQEVSAEIQERSQNEADFFMLDHMADQIETNLNLMRLFSE